MYPINKHPAYYAQPLPPLKMPRESWQAQVPTIRSMDQLTMPYRVKVAEIVRDSFSEAITCRSLSHGERKEKLPLIAERAISSGMLLGMDRQEVVAVLGEVIKGWRVSGTSQAGRVAAQEFIDLFAEIEKSVLQNNDAGNQG